MDLYPCAEPVQLALEPDNILHVSAKTSGAGPGYHCYVCELMEKLGHDLHIEWLGSTAGMQRSGYFSERNESAVRDDMLRWLQQAARQILDMDREATEHLQLSIPEGLFFEHDGIVCTPMGPRDRDWLENVARDSATGVDVFPWWDDTDATVPHFQAAISRMWIDVRWRPPLTREEHSTLVQVNSILEHALTTRPDLPFPWREWSEIRRFLKMSGDDLTTTLECRARAAADFPPIGYRRRDLVRCLDLGWSLRIPGSFAEQRDRGKVATWCGWDGPRTVRLSPIPVPKGHDFPLERLVETVSLPSGELLTRSEGAIRAQATVAETVEGERRYWSLRSVNVAPACAALLSVDYDHLCDSQWAVDLWHSLQHQGTR